ncbi:MAG TPA: hypothetical protein VMU29_04010 [Smithella sp.]|nr:hypothetical protein [Smithella sp.]
MIWYIIAGFVSALLLGWAAGIWVGTVKGYNAAIQEQEERAAQETWSNFLNQFKGGKDEN